MDFSLSEEQEMLKRMARDFLEKECPESFVREMEEDEDGYSPEVWHKIADLGWLGLVYPEKYGGSGGSFLDLAILYQEMGRAMFPGPHLSTVVLCGLTILAAGNEEQKADLLPRIANGDLILALALTEPQSSWDDKAWEAEGVSVQATPAGNDYVINGTKLFVHDAHIADYLLCVTRTRDGAKPEEGITLFLVDAKSPGISCTPLLTITGNKQNEVVFDKVRVPKKNMVGKLHGGWAPLAKAMQQGAVLLCAQMVGAGQRVLELTVDYAKTRVQFDHPIGINQYVQGHCVDLLFHLGPIGWLAYQAAWRLSEGLPCDIEVAIAKAWSSDAIEKVCWYAHQVHAGVGQTEAHVLQMYSRRAKSAQVYLGDTAYHLEKVADEVVKWPAPEIPHGKRLPTWDLREEEQVPGVEVWRARWEAIRRRKEERKRKAQPR